MDDKEYKATFYICLPMVISFLLFPAFCTVTILFGYVWYGFIIMECIIASLMIPCFVLRTKFLILYPNKYASKKRFLFETNAYIACLVFAIGTGLAVKDNGGVFSYYFLNIYIQPMYLVFVIVLSVYHIATAKKVAKGYDAEKKRRLNEQSESASSERSNSTKDKEKD